MKIRPIGAVLFHAGRHINIDSERLSLAPGCYLGAFTKLRKATISFVVSVCLSVRLSVRLSFRKEQLGYHWADFHEI